MSAVGNISKKAWWKDRCRVCMLVNVLKCFLVSEAEFSSCVFACCCSEQADDDND